MKNEFGPSQSQQMMRDLLEAARKVQREELMKKLPSNSTLRYLYANNILPTVANYLSLEFMGDISSLEDVGPEDRAEIEELIEDGLLVDTDNEFRN
jgi:hypothetical protein